MKFFAKMEIPGILTNAAASGGLVLFLGPEATAEAIDADGKAPPSPQELAILIADRFLDGAYRDSPLSRVSEYAISELDLFTVQEYIRGIYSAYSPSAAHKLLPTMRWHGLATTSFDRYVETAYEAERNALQKVVSFIDNSDRVAKRLRDPDAVPYLKLHGCISRTNNVECPLILTPDQSLQFRSGRSHVYNMFLDWARELPVVFLGYDIDDQHFRQVLLELDHDIPSRPRYYIVARSATEIATRHWEKRNVRVLTGSVGTFLKTLQHEVGGPFQGLAPTPTAAEQPVSTHFTRRDSTLSSETLRFLNVEVDYVESLSPGNGFEPRDFYRGVDPGWIATERDLDLKRRLADDIIVNHLINDADADVGAKFVLVKAHAGAGKSVLLRRIAWDAAKEYSRMCLYLRGHGAVSIDAVEELCRLTQDRVYLFVDDAQHHGYSLEAFYHAINRQRTNVTIIAAARLNEWNMSCSGMSEFVDSEYELKALSEKEVDELLKLLERHNALGELAKLPQEQRRERLVKGAGRQLLVALHEATMGRPFEDIIRDEYDNIRPKEAQSIYLSVCVLNRLDVPVRAGIISRLHDITFEDFKKRFFAPLERIIRARYNPIIRDYVYEARHPEIAQIVFNEALRSRRDKFDSYTKCLGELNIAYDSDQRAFDQMVRGRSLLEMFPEHEMVEEIYRIASCQGGNVAHLKHQRAVYEMNRPAGNLNKAGQLLREAISLEPSNFAIRHSLAEQQLKLAGNARTKLEKNAYLDEAIELCGQMKRKTRDSRPYVTLAKAMLVKIDDCIDEVAEFDEAKVQNLVQDTEKVIAEGLQRFPGDSFLLAAESQLAVRLKNSDRLIAALKSAFKSDARNGFVAVRLANCLDDLGQKEEAQKTLIEAINADSSNRRLHFAYARMLVDHQEANRDLVLQHLRRAFAIGDSNYEAQLLYAAQLYLAGEMDEARVLCRTLAEAPLPFELRTKIRYKQENRFRGKVTKLEASYCFVQRDGAADSIYSHISDNDIEVWRQLRVGARVTFQMGFTMKGVAGCDFQLEN